jgi:hypothetical protein
MSHEKSVHDGKLRKEPKKTLKEKRLEKKAKHEEIAHERKPRTRLFEKQKV